jgi:uncharacterized integral membrane protein
MSLLWISLLVLVVLVWALTIADLVRRRYSGWTTAGWLALIVLLPIVGSLIYWFVRKPTSAEVEQQYRAEAEMRHGGGTPPFGRS